MTTTTNTEAPHRRPFIPKIREAIVANCPAEPADTEAAIDRWSAGEQAVGMIEAGVFGMCDQIARDIDAHTAGAANG